MIIVSHRTYLELLGKQFRVSGREKVEDKTICRYRNIDFKGLIGIGVQIRYKFFYNDMSDFEYQHVFFSNTASTISDESSIRQLSNI